MKARSSTPMTGSRQPSAHCPLLAGLALLVLGLAGCQIPQPFKVAAFGNGAVDLGGDVNLTVQPTATNAAQPVAGYVVEARGPDRIALVDIDGLLLNEPFVGLGSLGENPVALFREKLAAIEADPSIRAVVLRIDSPGGGVTASDIMREELLRFRRRTGLPVVACLLDFATGGAYYVASAADEIVAHPTTITGGIGVILNVYSMQNTLLQFDILGLPVKAGERIDLGTPIAEMAPEDRDLLQGIADGFHERFIAAVEASRPGLPGGTLPESLRDGRIVVAADVVEAGLIDTVGYLPDALDRAAFRGSVTAPSVVLFRRPNDRALGIYDITPNVPRERTAIPFSFPGLERRRLPTFLYLWQPDPTLSRTLGP